MIQFVTALISGMLLAIPPGPATTALLTSARKSKRGALKAMNGILVADLFIFLTGLTLFNFIAPWIKLPYFRAFAGIFLIIFAVRFLLKEKKDVVPAARSTFRLTLTNPAAWLGAFGIIAFALRDTQMDWNFLIGFELGVFIWYVLLVAFIRKVSDRTHQIILRSVVGMIGLMGFGLAVQAFLPA